MKEPFLFRFMRPCCSPSRKQPFSDYVYDVSLDMVRWVAGVEHPLAIELAGPGGPPTKKKDIEKGEDAKDRRMWL